MAEDDRTMNIYRASRTIKRNQNSIFNALRSIYDDSIFVGEISSLWPQLPLLANLRCGLWYSPKFDSTCYFKSTDGHNNNWSFNTSRLNLHVARLAGQRGGCVIVDSTRKGKRFPDSMSKTIPMWTCVLNRAIAHYFERNGLDKGSNTVHHDYADRRNDSISWDCSLHLPLWVSKTEKAAIEKRLEGWTKQLEDSGADIGAIASSLSKPLRPLWISQQTVIWLNEVPDLDCWDFTPIILVSASSSTGVFLQRTTSEFSWHYISGAGDDEESWARGLSPNLFWSNAYDLISSGPELCNRKVADIVEKDRVYRARRGQVAPQVIVKHKSVPASNGYGYAYDENLLLDSVVSKSKLGISPSNESCSISWLGSTNLAVGTTKHATNAPDDIDCILNCGSEAISITSPDADAYLHLPIVISKYDRFSLLTNLPAAVNFAQSNLKKGKTLLICCYTGEDISICVCLAILTSLFDEQGSYNDGNSFNSGDITKWEMQKRLVYICKFVTDARPSRGNLKQVFSFLSRGRNNLVPVL
ncbi:hypothetical protein Scep_008101 [Stephania cephalantha]|uniref:Initiator tRNA phosphoribosyl transferase family protein n=1 Tax=Stephania cephalantha TaxID=152367 RepID=A0AAP0KD11_9MAGN